jgi:hypothetical protein
MNVRGARWLPLLALFACAPLGCGSTAKASTPAPKPPVPAPEIGPGDTHTAADVVFTEIAGGDSGLAGLNQPRDLAFNPLRPDELWVVNRADDSVVIITGASTPERTAERRKDAGAAHFMAQTAAIAFGADETTFGIPGTFATCGESRNEAGGGQSFDFMGPALWSSDLTIFAKKNPEQLGSHIDMLHNSPLCMGIAHESANVYWAFGGLKNEIVRYDFGLDHNVGQNDHSDGTAQFYATGAVKYVAGIPSHLIFDRRDAMLYVADTGNARIAKLDTKSGTPGKTLPSLEKMKTCQVMDGTALVDVVAGDTGELESPSGLEMKGDLLYVSDNANGRISAFTLDGKRVNYLETALPAGSLAGMTFGPDGKLYFVDAVGSRVLRVDAKPAKK